MAASGRPYRSGVRFHGIKFVGRQGIFAAREGEFLCREEAQQQTLLPAIEQLQLTAFVGSSASTLNVTAPQWHDAKLKPRRRLADFVLGDPINRIRGSAWPVLFSVLKREWLSEHRALTEIGRTRTPE